jgi:hypothetical protein
MQINYDLYNNILNKEDFDYVMKPYGNEVGEMPASLNNKDIVSGKINAILGIDENMPFVWTAIATNSEATTRREQEEFGRMKQYVIEQIMQPIQEQIAMKYQQQEGGNPEQLQQQMQEEIQAQTPEEVKKYMMREHQDPAEVMANQLLKYLMQKTGFKEKTQLCLKHGLLSALGVCYVGVFNGEPELWNVNSMRFNFENSPDLQFIEDAESAVCEYRMSPSAVIQYFGDELKDKDIDDVYSYAGLNEEQRVEMFLETESMAFSYDPLDTNTVQVFHCVWKSLRKIGFLTYMNEEGMENEILVDETYKLNVDAGDIRIDWEWIPETYETWKINDIYVRMRPIPCQFKDLDNLKNCKLPYYGVVYDNLNSSPTSIMDRLKVYQYFYDIILYKIEMLLASDKGKKIMMNLKAIPSKAGIDLDKWQYFFESTPFIWYDDSEEGSGYQDANTLAKVIDLSLLSEIDKYIQLAEYLRQQAGRSIGVTEQLEGQIQQREAVQNVQQSINSSTNIIRPLLSLHQLVKKNLLQTLLETAKVAYSGSDKLKLTYVLDDLSREMLDVDMGLLDSSTYGIFIANSGKSGETKKMIEEMSFAALQNQRVELSDIIKIMKTDDITEAGEILQVAEEERREYEQSMKQQELQAQAEEAEKNRQFLREKHQMDIELIVIKEEERRKTELAKAALTGASFNADMDKDNDGQNDFIELQEKLLKMKTTSEKMQLEKDKFYEKKRMDREKLKLQKEKSSS